MLRVLSLSVNRSPVDRSPVDPPPVDLVRRYELDVAQSAPINRRIRELHVLGGLNALEVVVTQRIAEVVGVCREHGASWSEIAATLHVSKQAAHERFGHRRASPRREVTATEP